jgi:hypothetical protein
LQHPNQQQGKSHSQRKPKQSPAKRCFDWREGWILHDSVFSLSKSRQVWISFTIGRLRHDEMQK